MVTLILGELFGFGEDGVDIADKIEGLFGDIIVFAFADLAETTDGVFEFDELAGDVGELLGNEEGLREEALDASSACDGEFVVFAEFVHTEDGDDVLEVFVALEDLLHHTSDAIVFFADDMGVEDAGGGVEGVDGGVDTEGGDLAGEDGGCVKVGEGGCGCGVGQVVGGDVDGLNGGDGAFFGGGDAFLERAHLGCEGGLVSNGRRHTTEESGDFGASLCKAEDVVDEEQNVLTFFIAEVFGDGEAGECDAGARTGGFVHLAVDKAGFGEDAIAVGEFGFGHFVPEVVAFAGTLTDASENGVTAVVLCDVVDKFLEENGFADACTTEETDLSTFHVGAEQVDDFDAGFKHLDGGRLVFKLGGSAVDGESERMLDGAGFIDGIADDVDNASERTFANGDGDGRARIFYGHATDETVGGVHGDGTDDVFAEVLGDFDDKVIGLVVDGGIGDGECSEERGEFTAVEGDVHNGTDDLNDAACILCDLFHCEEPFFIGVPRVKGDIEDLERSGATDDLDEFGGDGRLSGAVEAECKLFDEFASVFGGGIHGAHACAHFSGKGFTQCAEDLGVDVER